MATVKRTSEEWQELIEKQKSSGQQVKAWCLSNKINYHTFSDRKSRLKAMPTEKAAKVQTSKFAAVQIENKPESVKTGEIKVEIGKFTVAVQSGFSEAEFVKVCRAVVSLC